jgi:hypothetical protein
MDESTRLEPAPATAMEPVSADANGQVAFQEPYIATVRVRGSSPFLYHRWSVEAVAEKAAAAKGSRAKKTDDVESYVYRDADGVLSIPGEYFRQSLIGASRFRQDPRSSRKSAMDLFKAAVVSLSDHCSVGKREWDYLDQRRVAVQRAGITRSRPALEAGWECEVVLTVLLPEYIDRDLLHDVLTNAGRLIGVGDFRPTYGRFAVVRFDIAKA